MAAKKSYPLAASWHNCTNLAIQESFNMSKPKANAPMSFWNSVHYKMNTRLEISVLPLEIPYFACINFAYLGCIRFSALGWNTHEWSSKLVMSWCKHVSWRSISSLKILNLNICKVLQTQKLCACTVLTQVVPTLQLMHINKTIHITKKSYNSLLKAFNP